MKKKLVVLTGAGMSAESGISTFRDSDGLWENIGWKMWQPQKVLLPIRNWYSTFITNDVENY